MQLFTLVRKTKSYSYWLDDSYRVTECVMDISESVTDLIASWNRYIDSFMIHLQTTDNIVIQECLETLTISRLGTRYTYTYLDSDDARMSVRNEVSIVPFVAWDQHLADLSQPVK